MKNLAIIAISTVLILTLINTASAQENIILSINPEVMHHEEGDEFTVDINLDSNEEIFGADLTVEYDPRLLSVVETQEGDYFTSDGENIFSSFFERKDSVNYLVIRLAEKGIPGENTVFSIKFKAVRIGESALTFSKIDIANNTGDEPVPYTNYEVHTSMVNVGGKDFIRGDTNSDGEVNIADAINLLFWLFKGQGTIACRDSADANDDGKIDITDTKYILDFLFREGALPKAPYPEKDYDKTPDEILCRFN